MEVEKHFKILCSSEDIKFILTALNFMKKFYPHLNKDAENTTSNITKVISQYTGIDSGYIPKKIEELENNEK